MGDGFTETFFMRAGKPGPYNNINIAFQVVRAGIIKLMTPARLIFA